MHRQQNIRYKNGKLTFNMVFGSSKNMLWQSHYVAFFFEANHKWNNYYGIALVSFWDHPVRSLFLLWILLGTLLSPSAPLGLELEKGWHYLRATTKVQHVQATLPGTNSDAKSIANEITTEATTLTSSLVTAVSSLPGMPKTGGAISIPNIQANVAEAQPFPFPHHPCVSNQS